MANQPSAPAVPLAPAPGNEQTEMQQEQLLKAKYGGLLPKKKLVPRDQKYFDSADWQMNKQQQGGALPKLQPKRQPSQPAPRRNSQLGESR